MPDLKLSTLLLFFSLLSSPVLAFRFFPGNVNARNELPRFKEAPKHSNGNQCPKLLPNSVCYSSLIHVAMTLDSKYLRGSVAAIHSILKHTSCPENVYFHFISSVSTSPSLQGWAMIVKSIFPALPFKVYSFSENRVRDLISSSTRQALENPLNYARSYLADILDPCVNRVIYLDSDTIMVDDIQKLWSAKLTGFRVVGAPEYCHVNFTTYFTDNFWFDREFPKIFEGKRPCYFNTGVMVIDMERWRSGDYTEEIEKWMRVQKERRIYDLGSLPPFLLVFGGNIEAIDHRWNQHGLGGDNLVRSCRPLHPGPVSLLHWSGKGKPWVRLDEAQPCPVDNLWAPYDLIDRNIEQQQRTISLLASRSFAVPMHY